MKIKQILIGIILIAIFIVSCDEDSPTNPTTTNDIDKIYPNYYLNFVHQKATVDFDSDIEGDMYIKAGTDDYVKATSYTFDTLGDVNLSVKVDDSEIELSYNVALEYPDADSENTTAIAFDDTKITSWANAYENYTPGSDIDANGDGIDDESSFAPGNSLGESSGGFTDVARLGNGGTITLRFPNGIANGSGSDFAVFENGFSATFLELAYVEVSTDGKTFARFDTVSLNTELEGDSKDVDTTKIYGVAGKYAVGLGDTFDLEYLKYQEEVINGDVDLDDINYVRIVDIIGAEKDNADEHELAYDSFENIILDAYQTSWNGTIYPQYGFDLESVGVINEAR